MIDLVIQNPKTLEESNRNVNAIAEVAISKKVVDIDTSGIGSEISSTFVQSEIEALRKVVKTLTDNLKGS